MKIIMKFKVNIDKIISVDESGMPCAPNPRQLLDKDVLALYSRDKTQDKKDILLNVELFIISETQKVLVDKKDVAIMNVLKKQ